MSGRCVAKTAAVGVRAERASERVEESVSAVDGKRQRLPNQHKVTVS